jgi:hypothetical protein
MIGSGGDGYFPRGQQMQKYGYRKTAACMFPYFFSTRSFPLVG